MSEPRAVPEAVSRLLTAVAAGERGSRSETRAAVKAVLADLTAAAPGRAVEVRVPPFAAAQVVAGATHRRGTPPALVQMTAPTLLSLATGATSWAEAVAEGRVRASGERSDLGWLFPLYR